MDKINKTPLGVGATYPIYLTEDKHGNKGWNVSNQGIKLIENNLCSLLSYEFGQRIRQEEFGTRLWECLEEPNTQALNFLVNTFLREAINTWEPRIEFQRSEIFRDHHKLYIKFFYKIKSNQAINYASIEYDLEYRK
jgi:phage baseplate assembly protein W